MGVADWLTAVGTVGAVAAALWLQWWLVSKRRPKLMLEFDSARDQVDVEQTMKPPHEPLEYRSLWVRPRVANETKRDSAEDVEVLLVSVTGCDRSPHEDLEAAERLLEGLPLKWSEVDSTKVSIPPGAARHFDLLHVDNLRVEADETRLTGGAPIRFDVYPVPAAKYHRATQSNTYEVTIALTARNTDAAFYSTTVIYDHEWRDDVKRMREALQVKAFRGPHKAVARRRP